MSRLNSFTVAAQVEKMSLSLSDVSSFHSRAPSKKTCSKFFSLKKK